MISEYGHTKLFRINNNGHIKYYDGNYVIISTKDFRDNQTTRWVILINIMNSIRERTILSYCPFNLRLCN